MECLGIEQDKAGDMTRTKRRYDAVLVRCLGPRSRYDGPKGRRTEAHVTWGVTENLDEFGSQMVTFWMHHVASISAAT